jgi:hypothetical protein
LAGEADLIGLRTTLAAVWVLAFAAKAAGLGSWTGGSASLTAIIVLGVLGVGGLTGVLMWLAFYSDNKGYDDPPVFELPHEDAEDPDAPTPGQTPK